MLSLRYSLRFTLWIWALFNRVNRSLFDVPFTFWSNPFEIPESGLVCMYELWGNLAQFVWATHTRAEVWTLRSDWRSRRYAIGSQGQIYKVNRNMKFYYFKNVPSSTVTQFYLSLLDLSLLICEAAVIWQSKIVFSLRLSPQPVITAWVLGVSLAVTDLSASCQCAVRPLLYVVFTCARSPEVSDKERIQRNAGIPVATPGLRLCGGCRARCKFNPNSFLSLLDNTIFKKN